MSEVIVRPTRGGIFCGTSIARSGPGGGGLRRPELIARVRRAGAKGEIVARFDSGFWSNDTIRALGRLNVRYTMAVRTNTRGIDTVIAAIDEGAWVDIDYTPDGHAQVAETLHNGRGRIVRRTRLTNSAQLRLWPNWRHVEFLTDLAGDPDAFHRQHAVVELTIRDLKEGAGPEHVPSGRTTLTAPGSKCAVLAHNLMRWTTSIGQPGPVDQLSVARTIRTRLINIPARLVNRSGTITAAAVGMDDASAAT